MWSKSLKMRIKIGRCFPSNFFTTIFVPHPRFPSPVTAPRELFGVGSFRIQGGAHSFGFYLILNGESLGTLLFAFFIWGKIDEHSSVPNSGGLYFYIALFTYATSFSVILWGDGNPKAFHLKTGKRNPWRCAFRSRRPIP